MTVRLPTRPRGLSRFHGLRMSEEEYLALPEEKPHLEYVDGVALQKPMVTASHRRIVRRLDAIFDRYIETRGGDAGPEGRIRFTDAVSYRLPDTAYWAPGRPSGDDSLPTLAVEVRSPGQTMIELRAKCRFYRENGIDACWLIDPDARTVEVFEGDLDGAMLEADGALTSAYLPGFELTLAALFEVLDQ